MHYQHTPQQLEEIKQLPQSIQQLKDVYPISIANIALDYALPPLRRDDALTSMEIYFGDDAEEADWFIRDGVTEYFDEREPSDISVIRIKVNGDWAYIQLGGKEVFNRLGDIELPSNINTTLQALYLD